VYTKNFQKLHLPNALCKIKIGVLKKILCGVLKKKLVQKCLFLHRKKIGAKILHSVIFGVLFKKNEGSKNKMKI
jgi:hypothetical protein